MTLLRDLIHIPESVSEGDFVVRAAESADLDNYVVTEQLTEAFGDALKRIGHAVTTGRSQAVFLHGSFGSGKSHFMAVLREILHHNPATRTKRGLAEPVMAADSWLKGANLLTLTLHMLDAQSIEQAVLEGYLNHITALHPQADPPAVHRSDALLESAAQWRKDLGDEKFFERLSGAGGLPGEGGGSLAQRVARAAGWNAESYERAAAAKPGTRERDALVSALTTAFFHGAVRVGEYLDLDTGLQVITRHAKDLGYTGIVLFLDELILWLSTRIADNVFVNTEGAKLNKLVESADENRPLPIVSFVARQRNLEEFLGPQVGGTEREALATVMRSVQGRLGEIVLPDTNLPEIVEKRLLRPKTDAGKATIDAAFAAVRNNREVWETLLLGAQHGDAGIGSDANAFRRLYPFSPALVAALVALSQALQRERTALRVLTELLVARRDTLRVNDLIGVSELFEPLVLRGELPDRPALKAQFQAARDTYNQRLRPLLLARNGIIEEQAATHEQFQLDDRLIRTLLLGALIPEVPALRNLTAGRLHALNFGSITAPVAGYESEIVVDRLTRIAADAGSLHRTDGPDPVFSIKLSTFDPERWLDLVPHNETATGVLQQIVRDLVCAELGLSGDTYGDIDTTREWRGRRHPITVRFGNIRDQASMPDAALYATGEAWRIVIDYPFDVPGYHRRSDKARIEQLERGSHTVFWVPYFLTDEMMGRVATLAKVNYLLSGGGDRINTIAADYSAAERQQGKLYFQQRKEQLTQALREALKQAYGVAKPQPSDVEPDEVPVLLTLAEGLGQLGDPRGGTLKAAFDNLIGDLLQWTYPGTPAFPDDEKAVTRAELAKVLHYARVASTSPDGAATVENADRRSVGRIVNHLKLGELRESRYALAIGNYWSNRLPQELRLKGHTDTIPVHAIRELLDKPRPRGYDTDVQNLIIAVFALEQQLAWYDRGGKVTITAVQQIRDDMELRRPPMPDEARWTIAVKRARALFGKAAPEWYTPASVSEFAATVRAEAKAHYAAAQESVALLEQHAATLGIDPEGRSGRLATARRVAKLLGTIAGETDDVVVVGHVAEAEVGEIDDVAAAAAFKQAAAVNAALAGASWPLLDAVASRAADGDAQATLIIDALRIAARADQSVQSLPEALAEAAERATAYLVQAAPAVAADVDGTSGRTGSGAGSTVRVVEIADGAALDGAVAEIRAELAAGRRVRLTWEVSP